MDKTAIEDIATRSPMMSPPMGTLAPGVEWVMLLSSLPVLSFIGDGAMANPGLYVDLEVS